MSLSRFNSLPEENSLASQALPTHGTDRSLASPASLGTATNQSREQVWPGGGPTTASYEQAIALVGRSRAVENAESTLQNHGLSGSFLSHFGRQLEQGKIQIGVIDDFKNGTHGKNVVLRILENMPAELRGKVDIVRYDVGGLDAEQRAEVIIRASQDAKDKKLLALSVSGGINAYPVSTIEQAIGQPLSKDTATSAFEALIRINRTSAAALESFESLNAASRAIPVVTPVWNGGNTTMAALLLGGNSGNGIITSIDRPVADIQNRLYNATDIPNLVDVRVPAQPFNPNTSQSAPYFIANMLSYALERHHERSRPIPTPRDSGYGNGGLPQ
jgi:hypothetical protein